jgi:hypothetical protein
MHANKLLPLAGIVFVALVIVAIPVLSWGSPSSTSDLDEMVAWYRDHNAEQFAAALVLAAAVPFLVLFALGVSGAASEGGRTVWERMLVGGSVVTGAVVLVLATTIFAIADGADHDTAPTALQSLNLILGNGWVALNAGLGVLMLGAAGTFLSRRAGSRLLGWAALVLGIALFIPFADFFALLLSGGWIVTTSVISSRAVRGIDYRVATGVA